MREGFPSTPIEQITESRERSLLREHFFTEEVTSHILTTFLDELEDAGIEGEEKQDLIRAFAALSEEDKRAALAIPAQLRPTLFEKYAAKFEDGSITPAGMLEDIVQKAHTHGFTLGYHQSPADIKPLKDGTWMVRGTEKDHRNNDMTMAYYSMDYTHRYQKKPMRYLYVIRAETGKTSSHHQDNDGAWGRASTLAIVDQIDMFELEKHIDEKMQKLEESKRQKQ